MPYYVKGGDGLTLIDGNTTSKLPIDAEQDLINKGVSFVPETIPLLTHKDVSNTPIPPHGNIIDYRQPDIQNKMPVGSMQQPVYEAPEKEQIELQKRKEPSETYQYSSPQGYAVGLALILDNMKEEGVEVKTDVREILDNPEKHMEPYRLKGAKEAGLMAFDIGGYNLFPTEDGWNAVKQVTIKNDKNKLLNMEVLEDDTSASYFSNQEQYKNAYKQMVGKLLNSGLKPSDYQIGYVPVYKPQPKSNTIDDLQRHTDKALGADEVQSAGYYGLKSPQSEQVVDSNGRPVFKFIAKRISKDI